MNPGLAGYVARRLGQAVVVLWAAFTVTFAILYLLPSDPVSIMLAGGRGGEQTAVDPAQVAALRAEHGLDDPLPVQYLHALWRTLHLDFGNSIQNGAPVSALIADALPQTALLAAAAGALALVAGVATAFLGTWTRRGWLRTALLALPPLGVSLPTFWVGLLLVQLLSFRVPVFPALGGEGLAALVLPAVTLAVPVSASIAQVLARSLRTALAEPYVDTARAKGASRARVHLRHALRNATIPTLTVGGIVVGNLLAGAVVVETVFSRVGIGRLTVTAVNGQDIPLVQGLVLLAAAVFVVTNLVVDLLYPVLDPRLRVVGGARASARRDRTADRTVVGTA
ncbi:ABC transporter permease [Kineococcus radiotolerans]|uniref:Binding-protein-dependent transport systems inner membrane component n=1 Tax=Kineococcus radiotolerans (strain ATCC BAA-149 / DSM 14245 / SRS30216) TaxID=266940 RepID=A6W6I9_KINRD|nr:ABC transporter permease [Kineococcus radiotolerans]ABS02428.1 binding-protein-dependent transport systems inner membrane component [Kineococcus radiotolerans SRS30216 = ATCC BAA-149]